MFERIKQIFKRKKQHSLIFERVKKMETIKKPDKIIKITLCSVHKDFLSTNGKVSDSLLMWHIQSIRSCPKCKVEVI